LRLVEIVSDSKAILIGRSFTIDGFAQRLVRVVTHAHSDHVLGLKDSIMYSNYIVATPATHELLYTLGYIGGANYRRLYEFKKIEMNYYEKREFDDETIILLPTTHILGSAQVLIDTDGYRIGYTSDFKLGDNTVYIKQPDILVIEATYGHPVYRRRFKHDVPDLLIDLINEGFKRYGRVVIYGYHGKLQEVMRIIREKGVEEPFILTKKIYAITQIAEKYGWRIGNYYLSTSREAKEIICSKQKHIFFDHMVKAKYRRIDGSVLNIVLSGHEYNEPVKKIDEYTWLAALSDHADFDELIEYIENSQPRIIVVDGSREGYPHIFAQELRRLGWNAVVLPFKRNG